MQCRPVFKGIKSASRPTFANRSFSRSISSTFSAPRFGKVPTTAFKKSFPTATQIRFQNTVTDEPLSKDIRYTRDHEWVVVDGDIGIIGISDYAQSKLGDVVYVDLPEIGTNATKGGVICSIESVKAASDVFSPVSGPVVEVNEELRGNPALVNTNPLSNGWMVKIKLTSAAELDSDLFSQEAYEAYLEKEKH